MDKFYYGLEDISKKKKEKIVFFDLDGVIRNLAGEVFGEEPEEWKMEINGKSVIQILYENPEHFLNAKPTEYYEVIKKFTQNYHPLKIITSQKKELIGYSLEWVEKYFNLKDINILIRVDHFYEKESILSDFPNSIIIEDYPFYKNNLNQIVLIERRYNKKYNYKEYKEIIKKPKELEEVLYNFLGINK